MFVRCVMLITFVATMAVLGGCGLKAPAERETMLDKNWGRSYEAAKQNQILNPDAANNLDPVVGLDGQSAENNMQKYRKSFEPKGSQKADSINLNLNRPK